MIAIDTVTRVHAPAHLSPGERLFISSVDYLQFIAGVTPEKRCGLPKKEGPSLEYHKLRKPNKYSIQLAMLSSLLDEKLISEREYAKIKVELERKYKIKTKIAR
ncbi:hypothetical protein JYU21_02475 [Alkaliphilus sp. AH-315-G20]|nr:hypothetical protein [Alkaliphilus sp. AH-315-G20]